jgi:hypothetical protein
MTAELGRYRVLDTRIGQLLHQQQQAELKLDALCETVAFGVAVARS